MTPPPPKFGSRNLFNDSFLSFLRWNNNKSQLAPPVQHPDSPRGTDELQEKRYLLSDGRELLDKTKSLLEEYSYIFGKEATKRFRKTAAKLTKNAPSKSKLPKKTLGDLSGFHQSAAELYQEVENILREFEQHPPHPDQGHLNEALEPHHLATRSRSNSPPPLPRKPPSPRVTFHSEMQPESKVNPTRKESTRRGIELRDEGRPPAVDLARQDSAKPSSSSKNRDPKEEDITRSVSHRDGRSRKYDRDNRQEVERYKYRDDQKRSDSRRYTSDQYQSQNRDRSDPYRDRDREYKQKHYDPRDYRRGYDDDYDYDRSRSYKDRNRDRRHEERDDIPPKHSSRRHDPPKRVVHEDSPLSTSAEAGVPFAPTHIEYPSDRRERDRERERDRDRDRGGRGERDPPRNRDRDKDRDYDRSRRPDDYYYDKPRRRDYERDDDYYRAYDKYAKPRRYDDEYRPRDRDRDRYREPERDRDRAPRPDKDRERDRERDRKRDRDRGGRDKDRGDRDRSDRERDRGDRDRGDRDKGVGERDRDREAAHPPRTTPPREPSPPSTPTAGDPSGSKFQEVFTPDPHRNDALPPPSVAGA